MRIKKDLFINDVFLYIITKLQKIYFAIRYWYKGYNKIVTDII